MSEGTQTAAPTTAPQSQSTPSTPASETGATQMEGGGQKQSQPSKVAPPSSASSEMFEVKVNGKIVKMTRQEALDQASMAYAANDRFNEAKKLKTEADKILNKAKSNPIEALMDPALGLSKQQIRDAMEAWYHKEFIEPETLNEDQKKVKEYEAKLKKYEQEEEQKLKKSAEEEEQKLTQHQREYLQNQIVEAMESSGLPKTKFFASRMAFYMRQNLANGWDAPIDMIVKQVKNERAAMMTDLSEGSTAEQLIGLLGDGVINKIRQHDLKQLREKRQMLPASSSQTKAGTGVSHEKLYSTDVNKRLRDIKLGK